MSSESESMTPPEYDAILLVSFGGPESNEDVIPFLENILRDKPVPRERLLEVAEHYYHFEGKSPINDQNRELIAALQKELSSRGPDLPIYWGNRNWHPLLLDTLQNMSHDGIKHAIAFVTSAFSSYSGCRQYRENIENAREQVGRTAPVVDKIRSFYNHPGFIKAVIERVLDAISKLQPDDGNKPLKVLYTAHSIPMVMAQTSNYTKQLQEACELVSLGAGIQDWELVYQSRSGFPAQPWLEPDICNSIRQFHSEGGIKVCVVPIGFLSDHVEILYDLDMEASEVAQDLGMQMVRASTVGTHPEFVLAVRDLIAERVHSYETRVVVGKLPPCPDVCPVDCCPSPFKR